MDEKIYVIAGRGFVPGLPARVSMSEARKMKVHDLLRAAIENRTYVEERSDSAKAKSKRSKGEVINGK
jgi:hypothetical protein